MAETSARLAHECNVRYRAKRNCVIAVLVPEDQVVLGDADDQTLFKSDAVAENEADWKFIVRPFGIQVVL